MILILSSGEILLNAPKIDGVQRKLNWLKRLVPISRLLID
jgi:hypothetical protein